MTWTTRLTLPNTTRRTFGLAEFGGAVYSPCERYRYLLWRRWSDKPPLVMCLCNPSTATERETDPTFTRGIGFAQRLSAGGIVFVNVAAFRATDPKELRHVEPIGAENLAALRLAARVGSQVIAGWGSIGAGLVTDATNEALMYHGGPIYCLGTTKEGHPKHPLYIPADAPLLVWRE